MDVDLTKKYIDIWLSHGEASPDHQEIKERFPAYELIIWRSGQGNLTDLTADLLRCNQ